MINHKNHTIKNFFLSTIFISATLFLGLVYLSQTVHAQISGAVISPLSFEITGEPGESIVNHITVSNPSQDNSISVVMEFENISPLGDDGRVIVEGLEEGGFTLAQWISVDEAEMTLEPGESRLVHFTVDIPETGVQPGGHYASILARAKAVASDGTGVGVSPRVGALVLLTVPGQFVEELSVSRFSAPDYSEYGPIPFDIQFSNLGTVHLRPNASITVTNIFGRKVGEANVSSGVILPDSQRTGTAELENSWLWAGRYTATISGTYGRTDSQIPSQVITFWAFPWKVGLAVLFLLLFFIITRKRWGAAFRVLMQGDSSGNGPTGGSHSGGNVDGGGDSNERFDSNR